MTDVPSSFFPVLQIQHAVFNDLLALSGGSGTHTVASSSVRKKRRTMAWLGSRLLQQGF